MSSHADTIRDYTTNTERYDGRWHRLPTEQEVIVALDALLAENQRWEDRAWNAERRRAAMEAENQQLREALERIKRNAESWHGTDPDGIDHAHHGQQKALNVIAGWCSEALAGDAE